MAVNAGSARVVLGRRKALILVSGGAFVPMIEPPIAAAAGLPDHLLFDVLRSGTKVGEHRLEFTPLPGGRRRVHSRIEIAVKVAFITAYRYRQTAEDEWRGGVLVRTRIRTEDQGQTSFVEAAEDDGRLRVSGPTGAYEAALGSMTDLNFWNRAITRQARLIDSQNGELLAVEVTPDRAEPITVQGRTVEAHRFAMSSTRGRSGSVWYDGAGQLVQAVVHTRGQRLDYRLAA